MPRPVHFEIPADNPQRAMDFYSKIFGWQFKKWDGPADYWIITTGQSPEPGIDGGLLKRQHPNQPCVNTIGVQMWTRPSHPSFPTAVPSQYRRWRFRESDGSCTARTWTATSSA